MPLELIGPPFSLGTQGQCPQVLSILAGDFVEILGKLMFYFVFSVYFVTFQKALSKYSSYLNINFTWTLSNVIKYAYSKQYFLPPSYDFKSPTLLLNIWSIFGILQGKLAKIGHFYVFSAMYFLTCGIFKILVSTPSWEKARDVIAFPPGLCSRYQ